MNRIAIWKNELAQRSFRYRFIVSVVLLTVTLGLFTQFLAWVEQREGAVLNDPILRMIEPHDFTWLTFGLIYVGIILALVSLTGQPRRLVIALQAYMLMVWARMVMMYLVPLNPAEGLIVLRDPLVQLVGDGTAPTKDLFFSGHTSTMFLLSLVSQQRWLKNFFLSLTLLVALCVVWQHVHYVIDVAVAPFVAYGCYRAVMKVQHWL